MPKVLTVVGARPQFIKAAPVSLALRERGVQEVILHTGQHYDQKMSQIFFDDLGIPEPGYHLTVGSGSHAVQTAAMLTGIEKALEKEHPDWLLVYGDTNSTLAGALAAAKLHVPVAHVEAGLRSFNRRMPEEINRIVADAVSTRLFVPSDAARKQLLSEGVEDRKITWTGDVMFDCLKLFQSKASFGHAAHDIRPPFVLATIHRAENTDDESRLKAILGALTAVSDELDVVLPLHPRTKQRLRGMDIPVGERIKIIEPVGFIEMLSLERSATVIATDSGGVQKEAYFHQVPCVTFRTETEWTELVESGWNTLVDPRDGSEIAAEILAARGRKGRAVTLYGNGDAAARIAQALAGDQISK